MHLHKKENNIKTRGVPVLVVLVAAVFASSDLAGNIVVLYDVPWAEYPFANTYVYDIDGNNVVGEHKQPGDHGFLYNGTDYTTLDVPGARGGGFTSATGIDGNNVVGWFKDTYGEHGFLYNGTDYTTLDVPGAYQTHAYGIDGNNVVGTFQAKSDPSKDNPYYPFYGFIWTQLIPELLPDPSSILLGDIDGLVYNGSDSVDHVFVDPTWLATAPGSGPVNPFDTVAVNHNVPFTFEFPLAPDETVTDATLTVAMQRTDSKVSTDAMFLEVKDPNIYSFDALGWLPISLYGITTRTLDLSDVLGDDLIPQLQDGQLNVLIRNDVAIDYASLLITITALDLLGDANRDGIVSADDYVSVQAHFGETGSPGILGDASHDGLVSADDYVAVQALFGQTVSPDGVGNAAIVYEINSIPEPASLGLVALCAMSLLRRRSRFSS